MNKRATKYISFLIAGDIFAMPVSFVGSFARCENLLPVPATSDLIKGIIYQNGKLITVLDSCRLLGIKGQAQEANCLTFFKDDEALALLVDDMGDIVKSKQIFIDRKKKLFNKYIKANKKRFYVLDPGEILQKIVL